MFFDDYSNADFGCYYEITRGTGIIARRADGLHFEIHRAPDGPSTEYDHLTIDSLGRPHSPTRKAVVRFSGTEWTLEACVEYHFPRRRNGRQAYFWLVHGADPGQRHTESFVLIRDADLDRDSLSTVVYDPDDGQSHTRLASPAADRYRLRIERSRSRVVVYCGEDGHKLVQVLERSVREAGAPSQCIVMNSASFAGEASFVLRSLRLDGAQPDPAPRKQPPFTVSASQVAAADIIDMLRVGQDVQLNGCNIIGTLDIGQIPSPIVSCIEMQDCDVGSLVTTDPVDIAGWVSFLNCKFGGVRLSTASFNGPFSMSGCEFRGDSRFTDTFFNGGANFSRCTFAENASFRIAETKGAVSFHHATFLKGADLSNARFQGDLSLSDVAVREGSMSLYRSETTGTLRMMATLERVPQPLGGEWDLSGARIDALVISGGDRANPRENTGPALWNLDVNIFLRNATIGHLELYNVHFARTLDVAGAAVRARDLNNATFANYVSWPDFHSCFISYSGKDTEFVTKLRADLRRHGVQCFYAPEDIKIGDEIRQRIGEAIRQHDKLLLILSQESVRSDWVQYEVEAAIDRETRQQGRLLFPIRLDQTVMRTRREWAAMVRYRYHIGDFSNWRDPDTYEYQFQRLLRDLNVRDQSVSRKGEVAGHVFISYVREDSHRIDQLQRTLQGAGIPVWRDTADLWPGEDWRIMIRRAITEKALVFIACFSHASLARRETYQNEELTLAIEQLRRRRPDDPWLIPVRLDECEIPDWDIGGGRTLASIQRADLFGERTEEGAARLVASVRRILGRTAAPDPAPSQTRGHTA